MALSDSELNIVANIARYHSMKFLIYHDNYYVLMPEKIIVKAYSNFEDG